jgi:hypothetical protein
LQERSSRLHRRDGDDADLGVVGVSLSRIIGVRSRLSDQIRRQLGLLLGLGRVRWNECAYLSNRLIVSGCFQPLGEELERRSGLRLLLAAEVDALSGQESPCLCGGSRGPDQHRKDVALSCGSHSSFSSSLAPTLDRGQQDLALRL